MANVFASHNRHLRLRRFSFNAQQEEIMTLTFTGKAPKLGDIINISGVPYKVKKKTGKKLRLSLVKKS